MSQVYFTKLDVQEKNVRLGQIAQNKQVVTVWIKGANTKYDLIADNYVKDTFEVSFRPSLLPFPQKTEILVSFDLKGMSFFAKVIVEKNASDRIILHFKEELFKSERRGSFRLLTFPIYEIYTEFTLEQKYAGGNIVDIKSRTSQTGLFKSFLKLINPDESNKIDGQLVRVRVQDLSATGMSIHIGDAELPFFNKDQIFQNVLIDFVQDKMTIPKARVVYIVDYIGKDKQIKKYKVGFHFEDLTHQLDDLLGKKINSLLREMDANKEFEDFLK